MTCLKSVVGIVLPEDHLHGLPDQIARNRLRTFQFAFVFQLDLSGNRRYRGIDIGDARNDVILAGHDRAALRIADHILQTGNRQAAG